MNLRTTLVVVLLVVLVLFAGAPAILAQSTDQPPAGSLPQIEAEQIDCYPKQDNGVIHAHVLREMGGTKARLYFRWAEDDDFYYVLMTAVGQGRYWGVAPKAHEENDMVEYYVAVVDQADQVVAKSDLMTAPVERDCIIDLTERQRGAAENLTVGETTFEQVGEEVDGFLCDGVVTRINPDGVLRGDERCRACVIG